LNVKHASSIYNPRQFTRLSLGAHLAVIFVYTVEIEGFKADIPKIHRHDVIIPNSQTYPNPNLIRKL
jgi:hypothetical protein